MVQPDGRLTATNKVILKQLSFGDKVEGSQASLPAKLAVALLADRNGVIDLDLPISGSLMPKPRNVIGLAKGLPDAKMEKLLLADIAVSDDAMRELAQQRGAVVRDYLAARKLPPDRLVLGAAKVLPPDANWTPRAELNLAMP